MNENGRLSGKIPQPPPPSTSPSGFNSPSPSSTPGSATKARRGSSSSSLSSSSRSSLRATERTASVSNNNSRTRSPRAPPSRSSEPATEDDADDEKEVDQTGDLTAGHDAAYASVTRMQKQLDQMLQDVTTKSQKNQKRYNIMRDNVTGKDAQITRLHATYENLTRQLGELESLCDSDMDAETLDQLFLSIPRHEQVLASDA